MILMPCTLWIEPDNTYLVTFEITKNLLNLSFYLVIQLLYIIIMFRKDMVLKLKLQVFWVFTATFTLVEPTQPG